MDFAQSVKPVLFSRCVACHGPDEDAREAGLRLDTQEGAHEDLGGYAAIAPGDPDDSELYLRITSDDPDYRMPPPGFGEPFTVDEQEAFRRWIAAGGEYDSHWAYKRIEQPAVPDVVKSDWCRNPIDRFVLRRLEQAGFSPNPPAEKHHLARRLALDLTGLPPGERLRRWALNAEGDVDELDRLIDRMIADPAYGERRAAVWLDLARYADSAGYADDPPRTIWAYRDYVIESLAQGKPFDDFTIEQLAGDLLEDPTPDQLVATAMHRNTPTNNEGGTDDEEFRNAAIVDRVNTTMAAWMGTTMACAQCHTHKYDPITQEEYFRLFAIFNNTADADKKDESPLFEVYDSETEQQRDELQAAIQHQEQLAASEDPQLDADLKSEYQQWKAARNAKGDAPPTVAFVRVDIPQRSEFLSLAEVEVFTGDKNVAPEGTARQSSTDYGGAAQRAIDGNTDGNYEGANSTTHTKKEPGPWWEVKLQQAVPVDRVVVWNRTDGSVGSRLHGWRVQLLDEKRNVVWERKIEEAPTPQRKLVISEIPGDLQQLLARVRDGDDATAEAALKQRFLKDSIQRLRDNLKTLKPTTTVPVMKQLSAEERRKTFIQIRGSFLDLGKEVSSGIPEAFHELEGEAPDRLQLARWIVDRDNPLTARVTVNRLWEQLFGIGLVATSEDFGSQGALPTHPELLDWLAAELMRRDWDVKYMLRLIVSSATYQQSSLATRERFEEDPNNQLLTRGPRFRVSAEMVRDQALALSGLLSQKMFGPPVHPPRPVLGLKAAFGGSTDWKNSQGEDRYRRALYTEWRRSMPYPSMATFDVPSREVCTIRRIRTNTPLQALVTLNDQVYIEAARAFAGRILRKAFEHDRQRLRWALREVLIREPSENEVEHLLTLLTQSRDYYEKHDGDAEAMVGAEPKTVVDEFETKELAAWTVVGNVLLNLDELLQKP